MKTTVIAFTDKSTYNQVIKRSTPESIYRPRYDDADDDA